MDCMNESPSLYEHLSLFFGPQVVYFKRGEHWSHHYFVEKFISTYQRKINAFHIIYVGCYFKIIIISEQYKVYSSSLPCLESKNMSSTTKF